MKRIYSWWKKIAEKIGDFQATVLFSILYLIIVTPIGLVVRYFKDFHQEGSKIGWSQMEDNTSSIDKLKLQ
ncbi:MAG: hypothetical protein ACD_31C00005G0003 [uncultured bacterium]|uniref:Uncharacterized protein n=2 Tax=Candidatus Daviesiibacteriota TaxID=1752718 RepID=A0A1F5INC3_9BACT|nr:MAG: hypothetical protein ACD_31C00005G0003 [uncultured bacterium]KKQ15707.1 MAG: hypothetical protein US28_C0011G0003 [Candidatus Daviesbacteria bacterium GW2011_GWA1_36_8]OGE17873.1 MAG: hypothetical protein A2858_03960 [Candidatus Daviesbacteria bacterium RIFCSPHIGHO2_01_FULL_36_37]